LFQAGASPFGEREKIVHGAATLSEENRA
jgi:hypothetical protein